MIDCPPFSETGWREPTMKEERLCIRLLSYRVEGDSDCPRTDAFKKRRTNKWGKYLLCGRVLSEDPHAYHWDMRRPRKQLLGKITSLNCERRYDSKETF